MMRARIEFAVNGTSHRHSAAKHIEQHMRPLYNTTILLSANLNFKLKVNAAAASERDPLYKLVMYNICI